MRSPVGMYVGQGSAPRRPDLGALWYAWRPYVLTAFSFAFLFFSIYYAFGEFRAVSAALAEEKALNTKLTAMLTEKRQAAGVTLGYIQTADMGRAAIKIVPAGK